jgi:hypothetical protein
VERLLAAHRTVRGVSRRWITDELNHSLILRLAAEFQGYARALHDEASEAVVSAMAPTNRTLQETFRLPYITGRQLDRANARPETLASDSGIFGVALWTALDRQYPTSAHRWRQELSAMNTARNALAHGDAHRLASVIATGTPLTLPRVRRWRSSLDALARGMDHVVGQHIGTLVGTRPW